MPRYKVRAEGDPVRLNDQVILECSNSAGQYLHTSSSRLGASSTDVGAHEINLSVLPTALSVQSVFHPPRVPDIKLLHGGQVVQLFHKARHRVRVRVRVRV